MADPSGVRFFGIRKCVEGRGAVCSSCGSFACDKIRELAQGCPALPADGATMRDTGEGARIAEGEHHAETGFVYADIRRSPYSIPR